MKTGQLTSATPFAHQVRNFQSFQIAWSARVNGTSSQAVVGTSSNEVYVSLTSPVAEFDNHETVVWLGCKNAEFDTTADQVVADVWSIVFSKSSVATKGGKELHYYLNYLPVSDATAETLLRTGDGRCGDWKAFMIAVLAAQGARSTWEHVGPDEPLSGGYVMLVKNWQFGEPSARSVVATDQAGCIPGQTAEQVELLLAKYPYINVLGTETYAPKFAMNDARTAYQFSDADVTDQGGVAGKGNPNPASIFPDHDFVKRTASDGAVTWYDPSYGITYAGATLTERLQSVEQAAVAGYAVVIDKVLVRASYLSDAPPGVEFVRRAVMLIRQPSLSGALGLRELPGIG
jgi:hypothetical protein